MSRRPKKRSKSSSAVFIFVFALSVLLLLFFFFKKDSILTKLWNSVVAQTEEDFSAPKVIIKSPSNQSTVSGVIPVEIEATDPEGVARVEVSIVHRPRSLSVPVRTVVKTFTSSPYTTTIDTTALPYAYMQTVVARAYDVNNHVVEESSSITVQNSTAPSGNIGDISSPVVSIVSPQRDTTVSGIVGIEINASDDVGISRVEFLAGHRTTIGGDSLVSLVGTVNDPPYKLSIDTTKWPFAYTEHIFARVYDVNGNYSQSNNESPTHYLKVQDIIPPTTRIISPTDGSVLKAPGKTGVPVVVEASDNSTPLEKVELLVNNQIVCSWTTWNYSYPWRNAQNTCNWKPKGLKVNTPYVMQAKATEGTSPFGGLFNVGFSPQVRVTFNR